MPSDRARDFDDIDMPMRSIRRPPVFVSAMIVVAAAVALFAVLTYYGARTSTGRAADTRASGEALSLAAYSGKLAAGDVFDGYIQMLRYADDPIVNAKSSQTAARRAAMQQLLYLNVNRFASLTIADSAGNVLASTDPSIKSVRDSDAFVETRADLSPANSDIRLPVAGQHGYVEFTAPLKEPDGSVWGILVGRADPARLWSGTLLASVDGSRNVIVNSDGLFAAGVPDELLGQPWRGSPASNGGIRADIAGIGSICGLAPIGKDTPIDRSLSVASCLPASLIQTEHAGAMGRQGLVTAAGAVLAIVLAAGGLQLALSASPAAPAEETASEPQPPVPEEPAAEEHPAEEHPAVEAPPALAAEEVPPADDEPAPAVEGPPQPVADADALTLLHAYEQGNARLAERLRDSVQAEPLVAASQAEQAHQPAELDAETATRLHDYATADIERIRDHELRAIGQDPHPGLVRLGLPGALDALLAAFGDSIAVTLDADACAGSIGRSAGRSPLAPAVRLLLFRLALEATRALDGAGPTACHIMLGRDEGAITLSVSTAGDGASGTSAPQIEASRLAAEAPVGTPSVTGDSDTVAGAIDVPAPASEPPAPDDRGSAGDDDVSAFPTVPLRDDSPADAALFAAAGAATIAAAAATTATHDAAEHGAGIAEFTPAFAGAGANHSAATEPPDLDDAGVEDEQPSDGAAWMDAA